MSKSNSRSKPGVRFLSQSIEESDLAAEQMQRFMSQMEGKTFDDIRIAQLKGASDLCEIVDRFSLPSIMLSMRLISEGVGPENWSEAAYELVVLAKISSSKSKLDNNSHRDQIRPNDLFLALQLAREIINYESVLSGLTYFEKASNLSEAMVLLRQSQSRTRIRQRTYPKIQREIDSRFLNHPRISTLLRTVLDIEASDVFSINDKASVFLGQSLKRTVESYLGGQADAGNLRSYFSIRINELSRITGLSEKVLGACIKIFQFHERPYDSPQEFLEQWRKEPDAIWGRVLLQGDLVHFLSAGLLGGDRVRDLIEASLAREDRAWNQYTRVRGKIAEGLTASLLRDIFVGWQHSENVKFDGFHPDVQLTSDAKYIRSAATKTYEIDHLVTQGTIILTADTKSGSAGSSRKLPNSQSLRASLKGVLLKSDEQTLRFTSLIKENRGIWSEEKWRSFDSAREFYSLVISLDEVGDIASQSQSLADAGIIDRSNRLFIISLHDLMVLKLIKVTDVEFLAYLRSRTSPEVWQKYSAWEELDLFAHFLRFGLYEPIDPKRLKAIHQNYQITPKAKREFAERPNTFLSNQLENFDKLFGSNLNTVPNEKIAVLRHVLNSDQFEMDQALQSKYGISAVNLRSEMLGFSSDAWLEISNSKTKLIKLATHDQRSHTCVLEFYSPQNAVCFALQVMGNSDPHHDQFDEFRRYLAERKYFMRASIALGVTYAQDGQMKNIELLDHPYSFDVEMENIVQTRSFRRLTPPQPPKKSRKKKTGRRKRR